MLSGEFGALEREALRTLPNRRLRLREMHDLLLAMQLCPVQMGAAPPTLLGMSKRGDLYLCTLLVHGARSAIVAARRRNDSRNGWLTSLLNRRHVNIAAVALANKNVRTVWALLAHGREFKPDYTPAWVTA